MNDCRTNLVGCINLFDYLSTNTLIQRLSLINSNFSDLTFSKIFEVHMSKLTNLVKLDISQNNLSRMAIEGIAH